MTNRRDKIVTGECWTMIEETIRKRFAPMLGCNPGEVSMTGPLEGKHTTVILCRGRQSGVVVKTYARLVKYLNAKAALAYVSKRGIPCPKMLCSRLLPDLSTGPGKFMMGHANGRSSNFTETDCCGFSGRKQIRYS